MAARGLWAGTVWRASVFALLGCFLGRLHIFVGSYLTNRHRGPLSDPPPISSRYQIIMWLSGLRGGVAFAIAAVSYKQHHFPQRCGGKKWEYGHSEAARSDCEHEMVVDDGMAVLQMTMLVAVFTTFVLGGLMPTVAERCGVKAAAADDDDARGYEYEYEPPNDNRPPPPKKVASRFGSSMDNKAAPLLRPKTTISPSTSRDGVLWRDAACGREGSASSLSSFHISASPTDSMPSSPTGYGVPGTCSPNKDVVEESHGWLVRFLTHEEDYSFLEEYTSPARYPHGSHTASALASCHCVLDAPCSAHTIGACALCVCGATGMRPKMRIGSSAEGMSTTTCTSQTMSSTSGGRASSTVGKSSKSRRGGIVGGCGALVSRVPTPRKKLARRLAPLGTIVVSKWADVHLRIGPSESDPVVSDASHPHASGRRGVRRERVHLTPREPCRVLCAVCCESESDEN